MPVAGDPFVSEWRFTEIKIYPVQINLTALIFYLKIDQSNDPAGPFFDR
jgi:hypothetical protein